MLKGHVITTTTTVLITLGAVEELPSLVDQFVLYLYDLISQSNTEENAFLRSMACESLREVHIDSYEKQIIALKTQLHHWCNLYFCAFDPVCDIFDYSRGFTRRLY